MNLNFSALIRVRNTGKGAVWVFILAIKYNLFCVC